MATQQHISDTAYLVNESRARRVEVSRDVYAERWVPEESRPRVRRLWDDFAAEVYPHDDLELAVRNRFFLEQLELAVAAGAEVFVNLGAGFTSYPYLIDAGVPVVEVDFPHVVELKRQRAALLASRGLLPRRRVDYLGADLEDAADRARLERLLGEQIRGRPSFFLLEGVSYYLPRPALEAVMALVRGCQPPGSIFAFDFWLPSIRESAVFAALQEFFARRFDHPPRRYDLLELDFVESLAGYRPLVISDAVRQEPVYAGTTLLGQTDRILAENYAALERL